MLPTSACRASSKCFIVQCKKVCIHQMDWPHTSTASLRWESEGAQDGVAPHPSAHALPHAGLHTCSCCMSLSRSAWLVQQSGASLNSCTPCLHSTQALFKTSGCEVGPCIRFETGSQQVLNCSGCPNRSKSRNASEGRQSINPGAGLRNLKRKQNPPLLAEQRGDSTDGYAGPQRAMCA